MAVVLVEESTAVVLVEEATMVTVSRREPVPKIQIIEEVEEEKQGEQIGYFIDEENS